MPLKDFNLSDALSVLIGATIATVLACKLEPDGHPNRGTGTPRAIR